jgi:hypothetical protein
MRLCGGRANMMTPLVVGSFKDWVKNGIATLIDSTMQGKRDSFSKSKKKLSSPSSALPSALLEDRWLNGSAGYARAVELQQE